MSLVLRQQAQPVLNQYNLQGYHIEVDSNLHMYIASERGKKLVTVKGITFSRKNFIRNELEYAIELLENFLLKHINTIDQYIKVLKQFNNSNIKLDKLKQAFNRTIEIES